MEAGKFAAFGEIYAEQFSGQYYRIDGRDFVLYNGSVIEIETGKASKGPAAKRLKNRLKEFIRHDHRVAEERAETAKRLAGGSPIMDEILRYHMSYSDGEIGEPTMVDGIAFYDVGRNSSHSFAIGTLNGERWVLAIDMDEEEPQRVPYKVEQWGYLGHH
jgi:hypothetical protein